MKLIVLKHGNKCVLWNSVCNQNRFYRGDKFRVQFSKLGTLHSLLPNHINVLALTATATKDTLKCVEDCLAMKDVILIGLHSSRPNIKYIVKTTIVVEELASLLTAELVQLHTGTPKTVVFCRTLLQCANLLATLKRQTLLNHPANQLQTSITVWLIYSHLVLQQK